MCVCMCVCVCVFCPWNHTTHTHTLFQDDSIDGIYDTLKTCACISKYAGGIGLSIHNIRATDSYIRGTNGSSNGLVPMLRVYSDTARYVDQGGGKRKGNSRKDGRGVVYRTKVGARVIDEGNNW